MVPSRAPDYARYEDFTEDLRRAFQWADGGLEASGEEAEYFKLVIAISEIIITLVSDNSSKTSYWTTDQALKAAQVLMS